MTYDLEQYLATIERERDSRPSEAALADEIRRLQADIRQIAKARCLGNLPPGCAGNCVTCQARALLDDRKETL